MTQLSNFFMSTRAFVAVLLAVLIGLTSIATPAAAETAGQRSTRNIILGGLAAVAAVILYNNYHHKQVAANTVVGYTRDGGVVYGDGRVVYPDGTVLYTGTRGGVRCRYDGYGVPCNQGAYAYRGYGPAYVPSGYGYGQGEDENENENDDGGNRYRQAYYEPARNAPYYLPGRRYGFYAHHRNRHRHHQHEDRDDG